MEGMTLGDIEGVVLGAGRRFNASPMEAIVEAAEAEGRVLGPAMPGMRQEDPPPGVSRTEYSDLGWGGEIVASLAAAAKPVAKGFFPPG